MSGEPIPETERIAAPDESAGTRLDTFLARRQALHSRTFFQQLIKDGRVLVNGEVPKASHVLQAGEIIEVTMPAPEDPWPHPQDLPIDVVYSDPDIIVVNKAAGMIVHPAAGNPDGTLVNALLFHFPDLPGINNVKRPGIVHRLDRETSGVMVVAKNDRAMTMLSRHIKDRLVSRLYLALVCGEAAWTERTIDAAIGRHETLRHKRAIEGSASRDAITHFRVIARAHGFTLLRCQLETGRTHQIRVHCAHMGMPIAGDWLYGGGPERVMERIRNTDSKLRTVMQRLDRPFLHARMLKLIHPATNEWRTFYGELPEDLSRVLDVLLHEINWREALEKNFP